MPVTKPELVRFGTCRWSRRTTAIVLVLLYVASLWVRVEGASHRDSAGHGDVAGYYHVAKNLYAGRGFTQDYIADFLQSPTGIPTASNTWWLPLPSVIAWIGMEVAGTDEFWAAKGAMIAVAALVPLVVFFTALLLLGSSAAALAAGLLAVGFHLYLDQPTVTLSHGPYSVFASAALLCVLGYRRWPRASVPLFGLFLGLTYLCRGDSQVLVLELTMVALAMRYLAKAPIAIPWRRLAVAAGLFVLIVSPWWIRNYRVLGEYMPSGQKKITWARSYEDWFTNTSKLTKEEYLDWGWENIFDQKKDGLADAIDYTPDVMWRSVVRANQRASVEANLDDSKAKILWLGLHVLTPLMLVGLLVLLIRRPWSMALLLLHLCALAMVYGFVFPAVGRESYRSSMFSVMPILLTAIIAPAWALTSLFARFTAKRAVVRATHGALILVGAGLGVANFVAARPHLKAKAEETRNTLAPYRQFGSWWKRGDRPDAVFFVRNPWQFTAETGLRSMMLPNTSADDMLEYAVRFDIQYFLDERSSGMQLEEVRPGAAALIRRNDALEIGNPSLFGLYRISREALDKKAAELGIERRENPAKRPTQDPPGKSG